VETSKAVNSGVVTRKRACGLRHVLFARQVSRNRQDRNYREKNRPSSVAIPVVASYQGVFAFSPANAEPLFPVADVYPYKICDSPCGPGLVMARSPKS